jgi:hypothetical protein
MAPAVGGSARSTPVGGATGRFAGQMPTYECGKRNFPMARLLDRERVNGKRLPGSARRPLFTPRTGCAAIGSGGSAYLSARNATARTRRRW